MKPAPVMWGVSIRIGDTALVTPMPLSGPLPVTSCCARGQKLDHLVGDRGVVGWMQADEFALVISTSTIVDAGKVAYRVGIEPERVVFEVNEGDLTSGEGPHRSPDHTA